MAEIKWNKCSEVLPKKNKEYLVACKNNDGDIYNVTNMNFISGKKGGWNCFRNSITGEIYNENRIENVILWAEISELYKEAERMVEE